MRVYFEKLSASDSPGQWYLQYNHLSFAADISLCFSL